MVITPEAAGAEVGAEAGVEGAAAAVDGDAAAVLAAGVLAAGLAAGAGVDDEHPASMAITDTGTKTANTWRFMSQEPSNPVTSLERDPVEAVRVSARSRLRPT
jgi:hypothetical protein